MIETAKNLLLQGQPVAIPTETVYGLAAPIDNEQAIKKIFSLKKRPFFDPLIVHVSNMEQAKACVKHWPALADVLAKKFWPGPLTLVLDKNEKISDLITSGLSRVGLRQPQHPLALELIKQVGVPLAAPSANKFGKTSPTTADHVRQEFKAEDVFVLDGGPCQVGIESTVLLIKNTNQISILRQGFITASDIEAALKSQAQVFEWIQTTSKNEAPGHLQHHYMPAVPLLFCHKQVEPSQLQDWFRQNQSQIPSSVEGVQLIRPHSFDNAKELVLADDSALAARQLYSEMRRLAESKADFLYFIKKPQHLHESWAAILDRLTKAASLHYR